MTPEDRDAVIRTIIGEAADQPDEGIAAVGHVIANRLNSGKFGKSAQEVVFAPNQFEPWTTRSKELRAIDPKSPIYSKVGQIVDGVFGGSVPDPTGGATHFLQPDIVRARGSYKTENGLPDWAQGQSVPIGSHLFYAPENASFKGTTYKPDLLSSYLQAKSSSPTTPQNTSSDDLLGAFVRNTIKNGMTPNKPIDQGIPTPENRGKPTETGTVSNIINQVIPGLPQGAGNLLSSITSSPDTIKEEANKYAAAGQAIRNRGAEEIASGVMLPYGKSLNPASWEPGGVIDYGRGAFADVMAYPLGAVQAGVIDPGNKIAPGLGDKLSMLVPFGAKSGVSLTGRGVSSAVVPSSRASREILNRLPGEQLPESISRMQDNPRLTLTDVAPEVRTTLQGMVDAGQPKPSNIISRFAKRRKEEAPGAVKSVYESSIGKAPDPLQRLDEMKAEAVKVGDELINPAVKGAGAVDITPVIKHLESEIGPYAMKFLRDGKQPPMALTQNQQKAMELLTELRGKQKPRMKGDKILMDAPILNEIQSSWRKQAEALGKSSDGMDRFLSPSVGKAREKLVDAIDKAAGPVPAPKDHTRVYMGQTDTGGRWYTTDLKQAESVGTKFGEAFVPDTDMAFHFKSPKGTKSTVPAMTDNGGLGTPIQQKHFNEAIPVVGAYKTGLTKYREAMSVPESFERGLGVEQNRAGLKGVKEDSPQAWQRWVKEASPPQLEAARDGARWAIDRHIELAQQHARKGVDIPESNFMADKIKILFGEKEGNQLIKHLKDERDIAYSNTKLVDQSKTAETLAGRDSMKPTEVGAPSSMIAGGLGSVAAPLIGMGLGFPTHGAAIGGTMLAGTMAKNLTQRVMRLSDLARNKKFAEYSTAEGEGRNELMGILRQEATRRHNKATSNTLQSIMRIFPK